MPSASPHMRSAEIKASAPSSSGRTLWRMESHLVLGPQGVWGFGNAPPLRALRLLALTERGGVRIFGQRLSWDPSCFCYHKQIEYADARGDGEPVPGFRNASTSLQE